MNRSRRSVRLIAGGVRPPFSSGVAPAAGDMAGAHAGGGTLGHIVLLCLIPLLLMLNGCALAGRSESRALPPAEAAQTRLGRELAAQVVAHPGESGILPLEDGASAFAARMLLIRAAEKTLDVQYYIWRQDITGTLLLEALREAAGRGVRVRLLLDDNGIAGLDATLAALDALPGLEVRLFNPFSVRSPKALGFVTHFSRANRRMHNKSFTADSQATIAGGRNIGDEYFGAAEGVLFADLDVLAVGAVVGEVAADFDRYWASASAYPLDRIVSPPPVGEAAMLPAAADRAANDERARRYLRALRGNDFVVDAVAGRLPLQWSPVSMVSDDPRKGLGEAAEEELLIHGLGRILGRPRATVDLVSPYFVPTAAGVEALGALAARGVRIRILTNALEATDVAAVHAGYARRRVALLQAGIVLYELRRQATDTEVEDKAGPFGSSGSSLHAKTFAVDGKRVFVGSFNFDPRSARLNTELGFVIENPALAGEVARAFDSRIPANAYELRLDEAGLLYWLEPRADGTVVRHDSEPGTGFWRRFGVGVLSLLPIEWLL